MPPSRIALIAVGLLVLAAAPAAADDGIALQVTKSPAPGELHLAWAGGLPGFAVYRAADATDVTDPSNELGETPGYEWYDTPPPVGAHFYSVLSTCPGGLEVCNDVDDDCDGTVDNGPFEDSLEPNDSCTEEISLGTVGSDEERVFTPTLFGPGDEDFFRIRAEETDSSCACCDLFCTDEDYTVVVSLTPPSGAGSYQLCLGTACGAPLGCTTIPAAQTDSLSLELDGSCSGGADTYDIHIEVRGIGSPGFECAPYELRVFFDALVCH